MTKREKLRRRIERNPKNVSFDDLRTLLESFGFELKRSRGSHHSFVAEIGSQKYILVVPFQRPLKSVYVKQALAMIKQIEESESKDGVENQDDE